MASARRLLLAGLATGALSSAALHGQTSASAALWATQGADCHAAADDDRPWENRSYTPACRAHFVLAQFRTLDEKLAFLSPPPAGSDQAAMVRDVATLLGLPRIESLDGPAGVVRGGTATALPSPITLAASFERDAARDYGAIMAREFRAAGIGNVLGPAFDIARSWKFGRLSESMGEDPYLTAEMAAAEVRALADGGVMTTMKHYAAYAQEAGRVGDQPSGSSPSGNNIVSEKALREIYLPGFEAAVKRGGAGGVMCSFPRINGVYACEHPHLFDILKVEWGFDGTVGPDFPSAQRSITRAVIAGLDSGSIGANPFNAALAQEKPLRQAVLDGDVPEARVDDMILRKLIPAFRIGLYDDPPIKSEGVISTVAHREAAAALITKGAVLLKNDGGILPFGPDVRSIAIIGVQASDKATVVEQGSPYVKPAHFQPALAAIRQRAGDAIAISFAPGTLGLDALPPLPAVQLKAPGGETGFRADYFANPDLDFSGAPLASHIVADPSLARAPDVDGLPGANQWSVRYSTTFTPKLSGVHRFTLHGAGTARLSVDGEVRAGFELADFGNAGFAQVDLIAGQPVDLVIAYTPRSALRTERTEMFGMEMGLTLRVGFAPPDDLIAKAAQAARQADLAVVFVGERVGEGMDRVSLSLQGDQDALIDAVAAANPRTIVVLNTGGPVAMPWHDQVDAVLETWLPGDAFGPALSAMLFGDSEPGGRLPITFPRDETQGPATQRHQFPGRYDPVTGKLGDAYFEEGVFVGYRYWDAHDQTPLFPFGHGLGYGAISFKAVHVVRDADGTVRAQVTLTNSGKRASAEVVQAYLGFPQGLGEPPRQLKGFAKAQLAPGETRTVEIILPPAAFRHWDDKAGGWRIAPGRYDVLIGRSSRDIIDQQAVTIP